jgi:hypothetical protein
MNLAGAHTTADVGALAVCERRGVNDRFRDSVEDDRAQ